VGISPFRPLKNAISNQLISVMVKNEPKYIHRNRKNCFYTYIIRNVNSIACKKMYDEVV
jgi:hypothetical protein